MRQPASYENLRSLTRLHRVPAPSGKGYLINVASYKNGVGYGKWIHIDGWSEAVIEYIRALEQTAWIN
jgi:hypothetical protein